MRATQGGERDRVSRGEMREAEKHHKPHRATIYKKQEAQRPGPAGRHESRSDTAIMGASFHVLCSSVLKP